MPKKEKIELEFKCINGKGERIFLLKTSGCYPRPVIEVWKWLYQIVKPIAPWRNERVFIDLGRLERETIVS